MSVFYRLSFLHLQSSPVRSGEQELMELMRFLLNEYRVSIWDEKNPEMDG
jgi:hypothetical protein